MFQKLFGARRRANREITTAIYSGIVAAARQPVFYSDHGVPDTPLGRFELLSAFMVLFLHRMRDEERAGSDLAQDVTDMFFSDLDRSLRELGIGDIGIPKRVKRLARMFYGRATAYGAALDTGDRSALADALARNIAPEDKNWAGAGPLAEALNAVFDRLCAQDAGEFLRGRIDLTIEDK